MAKIHNPQDENGIVLINNTTFQTEVDERNTAITDVNNALSEEVAAREAAITACNEAITEEEGARTEAINSVNAAIEAETTAREAAITNVNSVINQEKTDRAAADNALNEAILGEMSRAMTKEGELGTAITDVQTALTAEAKTREDADDTLQSNITAEAEARNDADATLQANINAAKNYSFDVDTQKEGYTLGLVDATGTVGNVIGVIFDKNHIKGKKVTSVTLNILATNPASDEVLTQSFLKCHVFNNSAIGTELGTSNATEVVTAEAMDKNGTTATQYKKVTYTFDNTEIPDNTEKLLFKFSTNGATWATAFGNGIIKVGTVFNGDTQVVDSCAILVHSNSTTYTKTDKCHWSQISFAGSINEKLEEHDNSIEYIKADLINNIGFYSIEGDTETEIGTVTKTGNTAKIKAWITQQVATEDQTKCMTSGASVYKSVKAEADRAIAVENELKNNEELIISDIEKLEDEIEVIKPYKLTASESIQSVEEGNFSGGNNESTYATISQFDYIEAFNNLRFYNGDEILSEIGGGSSDNIVGGSIIGSTVDNPYIGTLIFDNNGNQIHYSWIRESAGYEFEGETIYNFYAPLKFWFEDGDTQDYSGSKGNQLSISLDTQGTTYKNEFTGGVGPENAKYNVPAGANKVIISSDSDVSEIFYPLAPEEGELYSFTNEEGVFVLEAKTAGDAGNSLTAESYFNSLDITTEKTVILNLNKGKIISAQATSDICDIATVNNLTSLTLTITPKTQTETVTSHIVVSTLCDNENYTNAQCAYYVIPIKITV